MKLQFTVPILLVFLTFFTSLNGQNSNKTSDYQIIPKPAYQEILNGAFKVDKKTKITCDETLQQEAKYLSELLGAALGKTLKLEAKVNSGDIILKLDENIENNEGYELTVDNNQIVISGKTSTGVFYGIQTLKQLMPSDIVKATKIGSNFTIPAVVIKDEPRFVYRGMHLDVGRHFFPVSFIKQYIDLIAMHKMNTFHWHLTEDQGWRIEIKKYPKLTEIGAYRNGTIIGHHPGTTNDQKEYGGFYTQEEIKEVVTYAASKHVTVVPEIELPGHSAAAIAAYPELSCFPEEPTDLGKSPMSEKSKELQANGTAKVVYETWGVTGDVYCAGKENTFKFLEDVLTEVLPLFPSKYIHIGGDECPKDNWKRCPNCQNKIKDLGLHDEHELQSYFIQRIEKFVNAKGKQIIGWDEILEGGLAPNATVMSWRGTKGGIEAAKQHHDVIMTPGSHCYFDHYQSKDKANEPLAIGGFTTVEKVYSYNPEPEELTAEEKQYILGAQGNVWTEYMETTDYVEYMILPRMTALSEVVWSAQEQRDWEDFKLRLPNLIERYKAMNLNYAKHSLADENPE
ncbi:beta-N-acetylhexosaminidase [Aestuariibaculum suncheonense]|uniref:beta-N-acetylhexosaminidase n=1 Tax=Aestuariibaculum suncheonense TaxID=1028745 RepID=A0A8J6UHW5_9FLAO|nr:beta-N-acetylhexosaminidase [Aestuariibaculum suncheonense]MBD0836054.1 beta-N-acetylhexosaminidase [Aestuariibaculum suncheonense]